MSKEKKPSGKYIEEGKLRIGDILFCRRKTLLSKLIRVFTKSRYSHTAIVVKKYGVTLIVESQMKGVEVKTYAHWMDKYEYEYDVARPIAIGNRRILTKRIFEKVGVEKYDFKLLMWDFPRYVLTGRWRGDNEEEANENGRVTCSAFIAWIYEMKNWWKLSPQAVFEECQKSPRFNFL